MSTHETPGDAHPTGVASINLGLSDDLARAFPDTKPVLRPIIEDKDRTIKHPEWVAGFTTGEGTFFISINKDRNKVGVGLLLVFQISQHLRDEELLRSLIDYFKCGHFVYQKRDLKNWGCYRCTKFSDNYTIIIEFDLRLNSTQLRRPNSLSNTLYVEPKLKILQIELKQQKLLKMEVTLQMKVQPLLKILKRVWILRGRNNIIMNI